MRNSDRFFLIMLKFQLVYSSPTIVQQTAESSSSSVQESYSASSSSYSSSSSSSTASIDTALYQNAFSLASISSAEAELYLQYLSQVPSDQITLFNEVVNLYSSNSFALADYVSDFTAFSTEISSVYETLAAQSIYAAGADWATQTAIFQQAQANLQKALSYTVQGSALYNLINFASTDLAYLPLVAGSFYHLANIQTQYYTASSSCSSVSQSSQSSSSISSSSSYSASESAAVAVL